MTSSADGDTPRRRRSGFVPARADRSAPRLTVMRWVTFDCFGTLVDWNSGFAAIVRPLVGDRTPEVLDAYHRFERLLEGETPHRLYRDVLATGLLRATQEIGIPLSEAQARTLPERWG